MPSNSAAPPATDLMVLLSKASHLLAAEHAAALARLGITTKGFCVLCHASCGELTQVQLAERCDLDKTTMVVVVDDLEAGGLARRQPAPGDRRARIVTITEAGRRILVQGRALVTQIHDEVLAGLPAGEREVFIRGLTRLAEHRPAPPACDRPVRRPRERVARN